MFKGMRTIRMSETDATGAIYFTNQLKFATDLFEHFLESSTALNGEILLPIAEVRSRYYAPLRWRDEISLTLFFPTIEETSFTAHTDILKKGKKVGETEILHVVVGKETGKRISIPESFRTLLIEYGKVAL